MQTHRRLLTSTIQACYPRRTSGDNDRTKRFGNYELIVPNMKLHSKNSTPKHIIKPDYTKVDPINPFELPEIHSKKDISGIRDACRLARDILQIAIDRVTVGMTTLEIDEIVHDESIKRNAYPSPLNYMGFPKSVCTSVNNVICHG
jgi:methionyl aminopeptidase